ncbi:MAG TPA: hypothetical protein VJ547_09785 [Candidatus Thermoplasmatota archaeon]|nr:hypothetical protein [Candidatus Thermoplasmatota archaeon]
MAVTTARCAFCGEFVDDGTCRACGCDRFFLEAGARPGASSLALRDERAGPASVRLLA